MTHPVQTPDTLMQAQRLYHGLLRGAADVQRSRGDRWPLQPPPRSVV